MNGAGRILAIDYGERRVGVAVSDPLRIIARGAGTLENTRDLLDRLGAIVRMEGVTLIVVGIPYAPDGGLGKKGNEVTAFIERLKNALGLPVVTWDESHTSRQARRLLKETGKRRKFRERVTVDEMAARLLLQEFLERAGQSTGTRE
jgi:putative Holliday junction resolvase